jgi:myosin heavy subunit
MAQSAIAASSSTSQQASLLPGLLSLQSQQQQPLPTSAFGIDRSQQRTELGKLLPGQSKYQASSFLRLGLLPSFTPPSIKDLNDLQSTLDSYKSQLIQLQNAQPADSANQKDYNDAVIKLQTKIDLLSSKLQEARSFYAQYQKAKAALDAATSNDQHLQQDVAAKTTLLAQAQASHQSSSELLTKAQQALEAAQLKQQQAEQAKQQAQQTYNELTAALTRQDQTTQQASQTLQAAKDAVVMAAANVASADAQLQTANQQVKESEASLLSSTSNEAKSQEDLAAATVQLQTKQDAYNSVRASYDQTVSNYNSLIDTYNKVYADYLQTQQAQQQAQSNVDQAKANLDQAQQNYDNNLIPDPNWQHPTIQVPHTVQVPMTTLVPHTVTTLTGGLTADSFNRQNYGSRPPLPTSNEVPIATQNVPNINFQWGGGYVLNSGKYDRVLVRFTGNISFPTTQDVNFYAPGDDGVQLYIDGNLVINDWMDKGGGGSQSQLIHFEGGSSHTITLYFYENGGGANVWLYYATPYSGYQIVPAAYLGTTATTTTTYEAVTTYTTQTTYTTEPDPNATAPLIHDLALLQQLQDAQAAYDQATQQKEQADANFQRAQGVQQQAAQDCTDSYYQLIDQAQVVNQAYDELQAAQATSNEAQSSYEAAHRITTDNQQRLDEANSKLQEVQKTSNEAHANLFTANSQLSAAQDAYSTEVQKSQALQTSNEEALQTSNEAVKSFQQAQSDLLQANDQASATTSNEAQAAQSELQAQEDLTASTTAESDAASVVASDQAASDSSATSYEAALAAAQALPQQIDAAIAEAQRIANLQPPATIGDPNIPAVITDLTKVDIAQIDPTQISDAQVVQLQTAANQVLDATPEGSPEYQHALDVLFLAAQADDIQVDPAVAAIPGIGAAVQGITNVVNFLGNVGADIAPKVRKKAQKVVVTTIVVGQIAQAAAAATAAGGGSSTRSRRK